MPKYRVTKDVVATYSIEVELPDTGPNGEDSYSGEDAAVLASHEWPENEWQVVDYDSTNHKAVLLQEEE
jgi:hypothetical protein